MSEANQLHVLGGNYWCSSPKTTTMISEVNFLQAHPSHLNAAPTSYSTSLEQRAAYHKDERGHRGGDLRELPVAGAGALWAAQRRNLASNECKVNSAARGPAPEHCVSCPTLPESQA